MSEHLAAWTAGTPCWVDLTAPDPEAADAFYTALFGWQVEVGDEEFGHYRIAHLGGRRVAGIGSPQPDQPMPAAWTTYLASDDADATAAAITAAGGTVLFPPTDIAAEGRMFLAADPTGAVFGVWQSGNHTGSELANEPGAFTWNECMSVDFEAAKSFYSSVFDVGWFDMSGEGFSYASALVDGRPVGGVGALPPDRPEGMSSHWMAYFKVADADASAAKVTELGGDVQREPWDTPFGRMVVVSDDQGAAFSLMADTAESIANAAAQGSGS
jgi:predicted enzyme related to lactoylglutathione lyase